MWVHVWVLVGAQYLRPEGASDGMVVAPRDTHHRKRLLDLYYDASDVAN